MLERYQKYTKIGLAMRVTIGGDVDTSGKNNNLSVIMRVRLYPKTSLLKFMNRNQQKKKTAIE